MLEYTTEKGRVRIKPVTLTLTSLRDIWDEDSSETKEKATRLLTYVHLVSQIDPDAPFANSPFYEVRQLAIDNIWRGKKQPTQEDLEYLDEVIGEYQKAHEAVDRRQERLFDKKIDQLQQMVDDTEPVIRESVSASGILNFRSNSDIITKTMKEIKVLLEMKEDLTQSILKKKTKGMQLMGEKKPSLIEQEHEQRQDSTQA